MVKWVYFYLFVDEDWHFFLFLWQEKLSSTTTKSIKQIIHIVSNKSWGGGEQYVYDLAGRLKKDGWRVFIVCRPLHVLMKKFCSLTDVVNAPLRGFTDVVSPFRLKRLIKEGNVVVHVHNFRDAFTAIVARRLARRREVKIVMTRHLVRKAKTDRLHRMIYENLDHIIFVSHLAEREFLSACVKIDKSKLSVIHNSIILPERSSQTIDFRSKYAISPDCAIAMYHGRLAAEKGVHILFEAMKRLQDEAVVLIVIGTGSIDYVSRLQEFIEENDLNGRIIMVGFQENVYDFLRQSDFGIVPSVVREAYSLAAIDYLSVGKPVVATNNGAQTEFLSDGENAFLARPDDAQSLTQAMIKMLSDDARRREMGCRGQRRFEEKMNYQRFYENILSIYEQ